MKILFLTVTTAFLISNRLMSSLPGRMDSEATYCARFGECEILFYMNEEKLAISQELIEHVNEDMFITLGQAALPCPTREIMVQAIKYPERDTKGTEILRRYSKAVHKNAEDHLSIKIDGLSWYMNLNVNWEALKIHHDQFKEQYVFMKEHHLSPADYTLVQDLTLMDWQMGKGTVAGTMVQDGRYGDRYILVLFPKEVVGTFYTEPAYHMLHSTPNCYPGHITMPPHSTIAPMDFRGSEYCGSSKGKRMSTAVRGIVSNQQMSTLKDSCSYLDINKRMPVLSAEDLGANYPNGITVRSLSDKAPAINHQIAMLIGEKENVTIAELSVTDNLFLIEHIQKVFNFYEKSNEPRMFRLIKKDFGFSLLGKMGLPINPDSRIIFINSSIIPKGYRYFNLAQDATQFDLPWIQLYHLEPGMAMEVPYEVIQTMALSPLEELIYRDEHVDAVNSEHSELMTKLLTQIDCIIY